MAKPRGLTIKNREGEKHGLLTVLWRAPNKVESSGAVRAMWQCRCECGNGTVVSGHALAKGHTKSCGCLMKVRPIKHGKARTRIYRIWTAMRQRCENPNHENFHSYGGRGITVCDRWQEFENFYIDMGDPKAGMTIERIDNLKGYSPDNCRWASRMEQANNRRTNTPLTFRGQTLTISEWSRAINIPKWVLLKRLNLGWPADRILMEPVKKRTRS